MKKLVTFRFDPDLLAKAKKAADRQNRSLTNYVETVLKQAVDERSGSVPTPEENPEKHF